MIAPLRLHLAPDKTRVVHINEGFDFLGWHIRRMRKRGIQSKFFEHPRGGRGQSFPAAVTYMM